MFAIGVSHVWTLADPLVAFFLDISLGNGLFLEVVGYFSVRLACWLVEGGDLFVGGVETDIDAFSGDVFEGFLFVTSVVGLVEDYSVF